MSIRDMRDSRVLAFGAITIDEIECDTDVGGVLNAAKVWSIFVNPQRISLVTQIGKDCYTSKIEKELHKLGVDLTYVTFIDQSKNWLFRIEVSEGIPKFEKIQSINRHEVPPPNIQLENTAVLYFQSLGTLLESPFVNETVDLIREGSLRKIPIFVDMNTRPASIQRLEKEREVVKVAEEVLDHIDTLKVNEMEVMMMREIFPRIRCNSLKHQTEKALNILPIIQGSYGFKNILFSRGRKGCVLSKPNETMAFKSLVRDKFENSLGCGDALSAGYCLKYILGLTDLEAMGIGTLIASFQTLERFAYPRRLNRELIIKEMSKQKAFFTEYGIKLRILKQRLLHDTCTPRFS